MTPPLDDIVVVLDEPQDPVNIAGVVRAMKNMGARALRLVRPKPFDAARLEVVAHNTIELVQSIVYAETLDETLGDCVRVAGFTARRRAAKRPVTTPRDAAVDLLESTAGGPVAIVFGREDRGLANAALDRCDIVVTIPTTDHASLNLAQAVLLALYELHVAAAASRMLAPPRKDAPPARADQYERLFADVERTLAAIEFFRTRNPELILRSVRSLAHRAGPDAREIELMRAATIEVRRALERMRRDP